MSDENIALESSATWHLVPLPLGKIDIGCPRVCKTKFGPSGKVDGLKACLLAKGYIQILGLDYNNTFSPVAKVTSVSLFISMAAICSWSLHSLDIKNAFLQGALREMYMEQPPRFVAWGDFLSLKQIFIWIETITSGLAWKI